MSTRTRRRLGALALSVAVAAPVMGLGGGSGVAGAQAADVRTVASNLAVPWDLEFLPDGSALVTERDSARVVRVTSAGAVSTVATIPGVVPGGEGGLLGIAISPDFATDRAVYLYFTAANDNRIVRGTYSNGRLGAQEVVFSGIPKGRIHNGGQIAFGPDGMLYASTGEAGEDQLSQNLDSLGGKILRMTPDGDPAPGNPFDDYVYAYGIRNVQGLAWDDADRMFAAEFGANAWDELNQIRPGGNYGWPEVEGTGGAPRYVDPVATWRTSEASPSGLAYADGSLWMASLRGRRLWEIPVAGNGTVGTPTASVTTFGRLRGVAAAPDGGVWVSTSNRDGRGTPSTGDDRILAVGEADPGPVDPGPVDPGPVDPGPVDPGPVDPGPVDPGPVDPGPVDPAECVSARNSAHVAAGRATSRWLFVRAVGSNDFLGFSFSTTSLRQTGANAWEEVASC